MKETQETIKAWLDEIGITTSSPTRCGIRANEEMAELLTSLAIGNLDKAAIEAADVVIVLFHLASEVGFDLMEEINKKMAVNRNRIWRRDSTGHGYHIKEEE